MPIDSTNRDPELARKAKDETDYELLAKQQDALRALARHMNGHGCEQIRDSEKAHTKASQQALRVEHDRLHEAADAAIEEHLDYRYELRQRSKRRQAAEAN